MLLKDEHDAVEKSVIKLADLPTAKEAGIKFSNASLDIKLEGTFAEEKKFQENYLKYGVDANVILDPSGVKEEIIKPSYAPLENSLVTESEGISQNPYLVNPNELDDLAAQIRGTTSLAAPTDDAYDLHPLPNLLAKEVSKIQTMDGGDDEENEDDEYDGHVDAPAITSPRGSCSKKTLTSGVAKVGKMISKKAETAAEEPGDEDFSKATAFDADYHERRAYKCTYCASKKTDTDCFFPKPPWLPVGLTERCTMCRRGRRKCESSEVKNATASSSSKGKGRTSTKIANPFAFPPSPPHAATKRKPTSPPQQSDQASRNRPFINIPKLPYKRPSRWISPIDPESLPLPPPPSSHVPSCHSSPPSSLPLSQPLSLRATASSRGSITVGNDAASQELMFRHMVRMNASVESLTSLLDTQAEAERMYQESRSNFAVRSEMAGESVIREGRTVLSRLQAALSISSVSREVGQFRELVGHFRRSQDSLPPDLRVSQATSHILFQLLARIEELDEQEEGPSRRM